MKSLFLIPAVAALSFASAASAQVTSAEVSVGLTLHELEDVKPGTVEGKVSVTFNEFLGAEAEIGVGVIEDELEGADVNVNYSAGIFGVVTSPLYNNFQFFGRLGYAQNEYSARIGDLPRDSLAFEGVAYGLGAKYYFTDNHGVRADFTVYDFEEENGIELVDAVNKFGVSYIYKF